MLQVREHIHHKIKVLTLAGEFCRHTTLGMQARILDAQVVGFEHIILDFSGVTAIDSTGLGELFLWYHHLKPHNVQVSIVNPSPSIKKHLDVGRISEIVPVYVSQEEAVGMR